MADQPDNATAPADAPVEVKVIPARDAVFQGVQTRVPATVSVDGKPVARCEDEAIAHLVAAIYQHGEGVVDTLKNGAQQIGELEALAKAKQDQVNELTNQLSAIRERLRPEPEDRELDTLELVDKTIKALEDDVIATQQILEDRSAALAEARAKLQGLMDVKPPSGDSDGGTATGPNTEPPPNPPLPEPGPTDMTAAGQQAAAASDA